MTCSIHRRTAGIVLLALGLGAVVSGARAAGRAEASVSTGLSEPSPAERPVVRPSLDEQLAEWRSACDHLAGPALHTCLSPAGD